MSVRLSEKTSSDQNSKVITMQSADWAAKASAMSGEPIEDSTIDPLIGASMLGPEKTYPNPATSLSLFQAASVLQVKRLLSG